MDKWGTVEQFSCICPTYPETGIKICHFAQEIVVKYLKPH